MAIAFIPSSFALTGKSLILFAPSSKLNSLCTCKCTKSGIVFPPFVIFCLILSSKGRFFNTDLYSFLFNYNKNLRGSQTGTSFTSLPSINHSIELLFHFFYHLWHIFSLYGWYCYYLKF